MRKLALALAVAAAALSSCTCDGPVGEPTHGVTPGEGEGGPSAEGEGTAGEGEGAIPVVDVLYVQIRSASLPPAIASRVDALLAAASPIAVVRLGPDDDVPASGRAIAIGDTSIRRAVVDDAEVLALPAEGYVLASADVGGVAGVAGAEPLHAIVVDGPGLAFGAYALLEQLGFAFLHPLAPTTLDAATRPLFGAAGADAFPVVHITSAPRWPTRNMHVHTMHPLELTDLLNGWGDTPDDEDGWNARLPEWSLYLEWLVANGGNEVEWVLLEADSWAAFAEGDVRHARLTQLVDLCKSHGVKCGIDVPIALAQQHTFKLVQQQTPNDQAAELAQIDERTAWLMSCGFEFLSTENGTSEFTHADAARTLSWMNELARTVAEDWGKDARIKIHTSTGQTADGFVDDSGAPLNFNFLPHFADARLGVMPHTVQMYGLDDEAPTYGNSSFDAIRQFLRDEAGARKVLWHPETAYWVSYDVDVPLFLPVYAERRLSDLRLLAADEDAGLMGKGVHAGAHMDGQSVFSSGWEWGYWLNDVVAMRAAWDPHVDLDEDAALHAILRPLARVLGDDVVDTIIDTAFDQRELLDRGVVNGQAPSTVVRRHAQAYLQGFEAYDDLGDAGKDLGLPAPVTQPDKLGLVEMRNPLHAAPRYTGEVDLLLAATEQSLSTRSAQLDALGLNDPLFDDLADALRMTALRAKQIHGLYDYVDQRNDDPAFSLARLADARTALDDAAAIVAAREPRYRVPAARIAAWRDNPTAYSFTYLWSVHSLYFWWRDEGKAVDAPASPCYLNIMNPADIALGEGIASSGAELLRAVTDGGSFSGLGECAAPPATEPQFPQNDLRSRP